MTAKNQILATAILVVALFVSYQFKGEGSISGFTGYTMGQIIFIGPLSALLAYIFLHFTKRKSGANFYSATIILTSGLILTQPLLSEVIKSKTISMQNQEIVEQSSTLSECIALGKLEYGPNYKGAVRDEMLRFCIERHPTIQSLNENFSLWCVGQVGTEPIDFPLQRREGSLSFEFPSSKGLYEVITEIKKESENELFASDPKTLAAKLTRQNGALTIQFLRNGSRGEFFCRKREKTD